MDPTVFFYAQNRKIRLIFSVFIIQRVFLHLYGKYANIEKEGSK